MTEAIASIPEVIAAVVLTIVSLRAAAPKWPALIALAVGLCTGAVVTLLVETALGLFDD